MAKYEWLDEYLLSLTGAEKDYKVEWGWWRYMVGGKLFAAILGPIEGHGPYAGKELLSLKCDPLLSELLRAQYPDIVPGFYMDKINWISISLDGEVPDEMVKDLCDRSHTLVFAKLTKKLQREIKERG